MALEAGVMHVTVEYGKDLRSRDWFSRQDPYCVLQCGTQKLRTKTDVNGAKDPVWNQTFQFQVINENNLQVTVYDEDTFTRDDTIGSANISFAKARQVGSDQINAPLTTKHGKQQGFISVRLRFESNDALRRQGQPYPAYAPGPIYQAAPPAPQYYAAPPAPAYAAPPSTPYAAYPQPAAAYYPPVPAPGPYPAYAPTPQPAAPYYQQPYQQPYAQYPQPPPAAYPAYPQQPAPYYQQPAYR